MGKFLDDLQICLAETGNIGSQFLNPPQEECKEAFPIWNLLYLPMTIWQVQCLNTVIVETMTAAYIIYYKEQKNLKQKANHEFLLKCCHYWDECIEAIWPHVPNNFCSLILAFL